MNVNLVDSEFSADYFLLKEDNQPVYADQFLLGLQVLATQATSAINNHKAVEGAFKSIQEAQWGHISTEAKNDVDQKIQDVRQKWVKVCFCGQFRHVPREHLEKNCGPKFHAQYTSKMKEATEPKIELLPPNGVSVDDYDKTIVKAFLDYFQTGTLSENALNASILDLHSLAHLHQIEGLITKCTEFLKEQFDDHENLDTVWEFANKQKVPQLSFACLSFMQANRMKVIQDKSFKDLKEKYEKALPVVKALFANEIVLNHSPSGNIEIKVEIFNEETVSHIEQLSKLFSIRSLVISEERTQKLLNNSEKLFPFFEKISPTLKDLEELIIWNETPKDTDFLALKTLFPNLTAFGNDAPFLKSFEKVRTYLTKFRNPDEDDPESEKLVLRSLNLSSIRTLDDVQMTQINPYLQKLYQLKIDSDQITSVAVPKATVIDCNGCTSLAILKAPEATEISCLRCTSLTTLEAPKATWIYCPCCTALTTLKAPEAAVIYCHGCTALTTNEAPKATFIVSDNCIALTTLKAPKAIKIFCEGCIALTTIEAPKAIRIFCQDCTSLITIKAPEATKIDCRNCTALTTLEAPKATVIDCRNCIALTILEAPKAIYIFCINCRSLKTLDAPEATEIHCPGCTSLTNVHAPKTTKIICYYCTSLTTIKAPKATKIFCQGCPKLKANDDSFKRI